MNPVAAPTIKSMRLAKARMSLCKIVIPSIVFDNFKADSKKGESEKSSIRSFEDTLNTHTEIIPASLDLKVQPKDKNNPFHFKIWPKKPMKTTLAPVCAKREENPYMSNSFKELKKRIKPEVIISYFEDMAKFTRKETLEFEVIYGEMIFDNSILVSKKRQVNLDFLHTKKFKSYKRQRVKSEKQNHLYNKNAVYEEVKLFLQNEHNLLVTCSQITQFRIICVSKKVFYLIIKKEPQILRQFFESFKTNRQRLQV